MKRSTDTGGMGVLTLSLCWPTSRRHSPMGSFNSSNITHEHLLCSGAVTYRQQVLRVRESHLSLVWRGRHVPEQGRCNTAVRIQGREILEGFLGEAASQLNLNGKQEFTRPGVWGAFPPSIPGMAG